MTTVEQARADIAAITSELVPLLERAELHRKQLAGLAPCLRRLDEALTSARHRLRAALEEGEPDIAVTEKLEDRVYECIGRDIPF